MGIEGVEEQIQKNPVVGGVPADPMEQVRELLFGEARRSTEQNVQAVEQKLEEMRADFLARFAALDNRLAELARDAKRDQADSIDAIGAAIAQLGESVQKLGQQRKG